MVNVSCLCSILPIYLYFQDSKLNASYSAKIWDTKKGPRNGFLWSIFRNLLSKFADDCFGAGDCYTIDLWAFPNAIRIQEIWPG